MCYYIMAYFLLNKVLLSGPRKEEFLRRDVSAVVCWCFTESVAEKMFSMPDWNPKGTQNNLKWNPNEPKRAKEPSKSPLRNRFDKVEKKYLIREPGCPFWDQSI